MYNSKTLVSAKKNYSQLESECLVIAYGFEKNWLYLLVRSFTIYNDIIYPIVSILSKPRTIVPLRNERLMLRLQGYDFKIAHISSNENTSDYCNRHPFANAKEKKQYLKEYVNFVCKNAYPYALTLDDIKATKNEKTLQKMKYSILENKWSKIQKEFVGKKIWMN